MFKRIGIFLLIVSFSFVLIACKKELTTTTLPTTSSSDTQTTVITEDPDLVTLIQVAETVTIEDSNNITENFSLLASYGVVDISWKSNNVNVVSIASSATTEGSNQVYAVTINPFTVDTVVILTATFTYNSKTYNKLFTLTVKALVEDDGSYNLVTKLYDEAKLDDIVTFSGYVSVIYKGGYVITDTVGNSIIVYFSSTSTAITVAVGDRVTITGKYAQYQSLFQIKDPTSQIVKSSNNNVTLTPNVLEDALSLKTLDSTNKLIHGKVYTVTVTPVLTASGDVALYKGDTIVAVVYYNSPADSILALKNYLSREVTIDVMYYAMHNVDGVRVLFYGTDDDIESEPLTLEQKFTIDTEILDNDLTVTNSLVLPELQFSEYGTVTISTSLTNNLSFSGGAFTVTRPDAEENDVSGTITIRISIGSDFRDVVINVTVKAVVSSVATDLFFSQYIEGSSYNKLIEIYNATSAAVDLSEYKVEIYVCGSTCATTASGSLTLSGTLQPGETIAIYNAAATADFKSKATINIENNVIANFNGDDALVLKHNGTIIDSIGQIGTDPGDFWGDTTVSTKDMTLIRKSYILSGDTNPNDAFVPSLEWDAYPKDSADGIGSHTLD